MVDKRRGVLFAVSGSLMFGLSPVFVKLTLGFVNVETMNVLFTAVEDVDDAFFGWYRFIINVGIALLIAATIDNTFGNRG